MDLITRQEAHAFRPQNHPKRKLRPRSLRKAEMFAIINTRPKKVSKLKKPLFQGVDHPTVVDKKSNSKDIPWEREGRQPRRQYRSLCHSTTPSEMYKPQDSSINIPRVPAKVSQKARSLMMAPKPRGRKPRIDCSAEDDNDNPPLTPILVTPETSWHVKNLLDLMTIDPHNFLPSFDELVRLKRILLDKTNFAIIRLLESTRTAEGKSPEIFQALQSSSFYSVLTSLYGVKRGTNHWDIQKKVTVTLMHSSIGLKDFLRALIAMAITDWTFKGGIDGLGFKLLKKSPLSLEYEKLVAQAWPDLHETFLRKSNFEHVKKHFKPEPLAQNLTYQLSEVLRGFLIYNCNTPSPEAAGTWFEDLRDISVTAVELWSKIQLGADRYVVRFPKTDEVFDDQMMMTEGLGEVDDAAKVHVAFFPGLVMREKRRGEGKVEDIVVFKATVLPQGRF